MLREIERLASEIDAARAELSAPDPGVLALFRLYLAELQKLYEQ